MSPPPNRCSRQSSRTTDYLSRPPTLPVKKQRLRKVKASAQCHRVSKWQSWTSSPSQRPVFCSADTETSFMPGAAEGSLADVAALLHPAPPGDACSLSGNPPGFLFWPSWAGDPSIHTWKVLLPDLGLTPVCCSSQWLGAEKPAPLSKSC